MRDDLKATFGNIDIYLFDQLSKGRFDACKTVLDAGCGNGRNLIYFLQQHVNVFGLDQDLAVIQEVRQMAQLLAPHLPPGNFQVGLVEDLPFPESYFDLVICSAVLHFARDQQHFDQMIRSVWRVLKPGGSLFVRLASSIGLEHLVQDLGNGRYHLPDGSNRFLVNEELLLRYTAALNGELFEYLKTTNVQNLRCMTTWCLRKI